MVVPRVLSRCSRRYLGKIYEGDVIVGKKATAGAKLVWVIKDRYGFTVEMPVISEDDFRKMSAEDAEDLYETANDELTQLYKETEL